MTRFIKCCADIIAFCTNFNPLGGRSSSNASCSMPSTPLRGVRISCDIDAINLPFASDAARAFAAAICAFSMSFFPVISWPTITTPTTSPFALWRVVALRESSTLVPLREYRGSSKLFDSMPFSAWVNTCLTLPLNSSLIAAASTRVWPNISWAVYPVISAAFLFHSVIKPFTSIPKMGAFADSINIFRSFATRANSALPALSSVMSWPTPTTPTISLFASRLVAAFNKISTRSDASFPFVPAFVYNGNSKLAVSFPFSALSSTSTTDGRSSGRINSSSRRPTTSHLLLPVIWVALRFHSVIRAVALIPKIGAFAQSISLFKSCTS